MPPNGIPFSRHHGRSVGRKKIFFFWISLLLFSHMENLEKHAMGRVLLTQKDEKSPEKDDLMIKKYPIKFYLLLI